MKRNTGKHLWKEKLKLVKWIIIISTAFGLGSAICFFWGVEINRRTIFNFSVNSDITSQGQVIDSLIREYEKPAADTKAVWREIRKMATHTTADIDSADVLLFNAIAHDDPEMISYAYTALASQFATQGDYPYALELASEGRKLADHGIHSAEGYFNPAFYLYDKCYALRVLGYTHRLMNRHDTALLYFNLAKEVQKELEATATNRLSKGHRNITQQPLLFSNIVYSRLNRIPPGTSDSEKYIDLLGADTAPMIRARYYHLKGMLAADTSPNLEKMDSVSYFYNLCFALCDTSRHDRRRKLTSVLAHIDYADFFKRLYQRQPDICYIDSSIMHYKSAYAFAARDLSDSTDLTSPQYLQHALRAADSLQKIYALYRKSSDTTKTNFFSMLMLRNEIELDSLQMVHYEKHSALVEDIHKNEARERARKETDLKRILICAAVALLIWPIILLIFGRRQKSFKHQNAWLRLLGSVIIIFLAESLALKMHDRAESFTHGNVGVIFFVLLMSGLVFHFVEELLVPDKE